MHIAKIIDSYRWFDTGSTQQSLQQRRVQCTNFATYSIKQRYHRIQKEHEGYWGLLAPPFAHVVAGAHQLLLFSSIANQSLAYLAKSIIGYCQIQKLWLMNMWMAWTCMPESSLHLHYFGTNFMMPAKEVMGTEFCCAGKWCCRFLSNKPSKLCESS